MAPLTHEERDHVQQIAYEDQVITTDLRPETLLSKIEELRPRLVAIAEDEDTVGYREITDDFSLVHWSRNGEVLGILGLMEDRMERPLLPAVVISEDDGMPSEGYFTMVGYSSQETRPIPSTEDSKRSMWQEHREQVWSRYS